MIADALSRSVRSWYPGATGVAAATKLSGGASQETWSFEIVHGAGNFGAILRRAPKGYGAAPTRAAGLAGPSILGVTIHPVYGPWMALRAAVLINYELDTEPVAANFDPCPTCTERACIAACPANAISVEKNWDIPACVQHRLRVTTDCIDYCRARFDCVYGREHRYPPAGHQQA